MLSLPLIAIRLYCFDSKYIDLLLVRGHSTTLGLPKVLTGRYRETLATTPCQSPLLLVQAQGAQMAVLKGRIAELTEKCSNMARALSQQSLPKAGSQDDPNPAPADPTPAPADPTPALPGSRDPGGQGGESQPANLKSEQCREVPSPPPGFPPDVRINKIFLCEKFDKRNFSTTFGQEGRLPEGQ
jgi:hypothetical protein